MSAPLGSAPLGLVTRRGGSTLGTALAGVLLWAVAGAVLWFGRTALGAAHFAFAGALLAAGGICIDRELATAVLKTLVTVVGQLVRLLPMLRSALPDSAAPASASTLAAAPSVAPGEAP